MRENRPTTDRKLVWTLRWGYYWSGQLPPIGFKNLNKKGYIIQVGRTALVLEPHFRVPSESSVPLESRGLDRRRHWGIFSSTLPFCRIWRRWERLRPLPGWELCCRWGRWTEPRMTSMGNSSCNRCPGFFDHPPPEGLPNDCNWSAIKMQTIAFWTGHSVAR